MRVLLTGAAGFVGSHVLRHLLVETDWDIVCPVTFRHKGTPRRIESTLNGFGSEARERVKLRMLDLTAPVDPVSRDLIGKVDVIMNVASESHVDRSIADPVPFVRNNVDLMLNVLELARDIRPRMVLQMSTDEVYGPAYLDDRHEEWDPIRPSNPYSASKAAQEALCHSWWRTYGVPVVITNTMNIFGEMQDPEKFVPLIIRCLRRGIPVPVHVSLSGEPGSRFYLHARNLADAWLYLARNLNPNSYSAGDTEPSRFHIVGEREINNIEMVSLISNAMGLDPGHGRIELSRHHTTRPGHDLRYALDGTKLAEFGWKPPVAFEDALTKTVRWTLDHPEWLAT